MIHQTQSIPGIYTLYLWAICFWCLGGIPHAWALTPVAPDLPGNQAFPSIAADDTGSYMVAWLNEIPSENGTDTSGTAQYHVYVQGFDPDHIPLGQPVRLNTLPLDGSMAPILKMTPKGRAVAAWLEPAATGKEYDIRVQVLNEKGEPQGVSFIANTGTKVFKGLTSTPHFDLAVNEKKDYVLVWAGVCDDAFSSRDIYARVLSMDETKDEPEFKVNTHTFGNEVRPAVALGQSGNMVVAWYNDQVVSRKLYTNPIYPKFSKAAFVYARRLTSSGKADHSEFRVSEKFSNLYIAPGIDLTMDRDENFTIAWAGGDSRVYEMAARGVISGCMNQVFFKRYDCFTIPTIKETPVVDSNYYSLHEPEVIIGKDGFIMVLWQRDSAYQPEKRGLYFRLFNPAGEAVNEPLTVQLPTSDHGFPNCFPADMAATPTGDLQCVWHMIQEGEQRIFMTTLDPDIAGPYAVNPVTIREDIDIQSPEDLAFNPDFYLSRYPDLKAAGYTRDTAKQHWLNFGLSEGRQGSIFFDPQYYLFRHLDIATAFEHNFEEAYQHFLNWGIYEGRRLSPCFDPVVYLKKNPDLAALFGNDYFRAVKHYVEYGILEGRQAAENFRVTDYLSANPDVQAHYGDDLRAAAMHWAFEGIFQGRRGIRPETGP